MSILGESEVLPPLVEEGAVLLWVGLWAGFLGGQGLSRPKSRAWCSGWRGQRTEKVRPNLGRVSGGEQVPNLGRDIGSDPMPPLIEALVEFTLPGDPWLP